MKKRLRNHYRTRPLTADEYARMEAAVERQTLWGHVPSVHYPDDVVQRAQQEEIAETARRLAELAEPVDMCAPLTRETFEAAWRFLLDPPTPPWWSRVLMWERGSKVWSKAYSWVPGRAPDVLEIPPPPAPPPVPAPAATG